MTSSPRKDIPSIGSIGGQAAPAALERVREEVQVLLGHRGNELDQAATWRQLVERGFAQRQVVPGGGGPFVPVPNPGGGGEDEELDLTPPPTPTGLDVTAGFSSLIVEWDPPIYTQGHGHGQTNIYGAQWPLDDPTEPTFSEAVPLGAAPGAMTVAAIPSNPSTRWKIWIKWQSRDGVESLPAGGTNGVEATTGIDIDTVLEALTGQITSSQLFADLGDSIAQIPIIQANLASLIEAPDYDNGATYNPGDIVKSGGSLYQCIATTTGNAPPNATYWTLIGDFDSLAGAVAAHTIAIDDLDSRITAAEGDITAEIAARVLLAAQVGTNTAAIATESSVRASADSALASSITVLSATVDGNTAAIAAEASARATADGQLYAQYTVKVDVNGYVSGFGLASTANNGAPTSSFIVRADNFAVASPSGPGITPIVPFTVRTTPGTINGVPVPVGVYMDAAYILRGSITAAQIGNAVIDDAKIANLSAAKLTVGDGTIGGNLRSTNYSAGAAGWIVRPDGYAEFSAAVIRGQLVASQINANGLVIRDGAGNPILGAGTPLQAPYFAALIGGGNLLFNSSLEARTTPDTAGTGWTFYNNSPITEITTITTVPGRLGGFAVRHAWTGTNTSTKGLNTDIGLGGGVGGGWQIGRTYVVSFYARADTAKATGCALAWNVAPSSTTNLQNPNLTTAWQRYAFRITWGGSVEGGGRLYPYAGTAITGYLEFDDLQVEEGEILTAYAPGARDRPGVDNPITAANISTYIAAAAIGNAQIGNIIQSTAYTPGSAGWRINKDGSAEFHNIYARGDIQATNLSAATGTFTGALVAATGTFSGSLTADAISAVSTINLAGEAVTIPRGTELDSDFNYGALGAWVTVLSETMNPLGGSIIATAIGKIVVNPYGGGSVVDLDVRLLINGEQKMTDGISTTGATGQREGFALQGITQSLTGNITVELQARRAGVTSAGTPRIAAGTSLIVIGARR